MPVLGGIAFGCALGIGAALYLLQLYRKPTGKERDWRNILNHLEKVSRVFFSSVAASKHFKGKKAGQNSHLRQGTPERQL